MVKTSTAEKNNYRCPVCGDELKQDNAGRGYVAHVLNPHCQFEKGKKDQVGATSVGRKTCPPILSDHEPTDGIRICGYSERGIFNALLYEIGFSADPIGTLAGLLTLICVSDSTRDFSDLCGAEVLVEQ